MKHIKLASRQLLLCTDAAKSMLLLGVAVGFLLSFCLSSFAQLNLGSISGAVTDQTGGAIAGAAVNVIDVARGISRPLTTDAAGEYSAPSLTPGMYTVRVEATGFQSVNRENILLQVGQDVRVDVALKPGAQTQTITVTEALPMVNTTNAQLGGMLENLSVEELPVNGRDYGYLLEDRPGMVQYRQAGSNSFSGNGADTNQNAWMLDGLYDGNIYSSGGYIAGGENTGTDEADILPLDAIQEVSIIELPKAEYGWKMGAHVNVGLKSGTNSLHGTAYAFGRDTSLDAKNPFLLPTEPKAPLAFEQFGASVGGPIKKNKLFYFVNYEGMRFSVGVPTLVHEPTTADLPGTTGATGSSIPDALYDILQNHTNVSPSALSMNLAGCGALVNSAGGVTSGNFTPAQVTTLRSDSLATLVAGCSATSSLFGSNGGTSTSYVADFLGTGRSDNGIAKVDYHPSDHNALNGEVFTGGGPGILPGAAVEPYWLGSIYSKANVVRAVWVWTPNAKWVNEFRFGYDYANYPIFNYECQKPGIGPDYASLGFIPGNFPCPPNNPVYGGFPVTTVSGFNNLGNAQGNFQDEAMHYYAASDSVSYTRGKHMFKFGGEMRFNFFDGEGSSNGRGTLSFGTLAPFTGATALEDFMAGAASSGVILVGQQFNSFYFNGYAGYAQDDWRVLPKLTLNLGLRYEYTGSIWAVGNHMANFLPNDPSLGPTGLIQQTPGHNLYSLSPYDFAPRLGLAWDVTGKGTTVVRAGFNMIYSTMATMTHEISSVGAFLQAMPSGFTFYNPNGSTFSGSGNIDSGIVTLATSQIPWDINVPVFNAASPSGLVCGDGVAPVNRVSGAPAVEPPPCQIQAINPNQGHQGQMYYRNLGIQHAFTNNLSLDVNYVGSHGAKLNAGGGNLNTPPPGAKNTTANGYIEQARRPLNAEYPFYGVINYETDFVESNYNGLQTSLTQRVAHGLNFTAGYTLAHSLDNSATLLIPQEPLIDYGNSAFDVRNTFTFTATYFVPGRKSPAQLLEGWEMNTSVILQSGFPLAAKDTTNDISGTGELVDRWTLSGNPNDFKTGGPGPIPCWGVSGSSFSKAANCTTVASVTNMPALCQTAAAAEPVNSSLPAGTPNATGLTALAAYGCYMMGASVMVPPAQGTYGTMAPNELYYKAFPNWNLSATKTWKFKERYSAQFRADFYNVLNRTSYAAPSANLASPTTFGESQSTPDVSNPVIGSGPRKIQFGLKLIF